MLIIAISLYTTMRKKNMKPKSCNVCLTMIANAQCFYIRTRCNKDTRYSSHNEQLGC